MKMQISMIYIFIEKREIVSSNRKGDPSIYKISIEIDYSLTSNGQVVLQNEISNKLHTIISMTNLIY